MDDTVICHIAIADDWEMSRGFGEYEVATRGVHLDETGFIHATTPDRIDSVLAAVFGGLRLPLLRIDLSVPGLRGAGVEVTWVDGVPRIGGPIPMTDEVVLRETAIAAT